MFGGGARMMADYVYCGTEPPVDAGGTQQLLVGPFKAIWYPPHSRLRAEPSGGDRIWLVWRAYPMAVPLLLGGGRVLITGDGSALWTNKSLPGVRPAAEQLGYPGPTNMDFLHLSDVVIPAGLPTVNVGGISAGLNVATPQQVGVLSHVLPIP